MYSESNLINWFKRNWSVRSLFRTAVVLVVLIVIHALLLRFNNNINSIAGWFHIWLDLLNEYAGIGIVALGMTYVIICGGIDLSVGAMAAAVSAVAVMFADAGPSGIMQTAGIHGIPAYAASICGSIVFGAVLGHITGFLISRGNIPPLIVTLGTMMLYRSLTQHLMASNNPVIPWGFRQLTLFKVSGSVFLPILYWLVLAISLHIILNGTVFGKYVTAVGSDEKAAWLAGINIGQVKRRVYMLAGMTTAVTAILQVTAAGAPNYAVAGSGYAMDAITACLLGGARLGGGRGFIAGTVMGTMIIAILNNIPGLTDISPYIREACKGVVIIGAVLLQRKDN